MEVRPLDHSRIASPDEAGLIRSIAVFREPAEAATDAMPFAIRLAGRLGGRVLPGSAPSGHGYPARDVARGPGAASPDLLVLGSVGPSRAGGFRLAGNAYRDLQAAAVPCLIARGSLSLPLRRALLPVVPEDLASDVLPLAVEWLTRYLRTESAAANPSRPLELHLLHVAPNAVEERLMDIHLTHLSRALLEETGPNPPVRLRKLVHVAGDPAAEILRVAERNSIDLILLRAPARPVGRAGGVVGAVLHGAQCPLVLFPPRLRAGAEQHAAPPTPAA